MPFLDETGLASYDTKIKAVISATDAKVDELIDDVYAGHDYSSSATYTYGDYVMYDGGIYDAATDITTAENWTDYKWRSVSTLGEIAKLKSALDIKDIDIENDYITFPLYLTVGRLVTSDGQLRNDTPTAAVVQRRVLSGYINTNDIDAILVDTSVFNTDIYYYKYDATKTLIESMHITPAQITALTTKLIATPKTCAFFRINGVISPDTSGNNYDREKLLSSKHIVGVKFLNSNVYNSVTDETEIRIPAGIGNVANREESFSYTNKRARTDYLRTADYDAIRFDNSLTTNSYQVNIRYYDNIGDIDQVSDDAYTSADKIQIGKTYPYFRLQFYDLNDPTEGVVDVGDIRRVARLVKSNVYGDIITLNNKIETPLKLQQISTNINAKSTAQVQPLVMLHFSDLHRNSTALKRVVQYADYYSNYLDDVIHTGDNVGSTRSTHIFGDVPGAEKILNVIGNHDTWVGGDENQTYEDWRYLSEADTYSTYISPFVSNWGSVTTVSNKAYYYKDYPEKNVRLIVIDCMHETADQITWFGTALSGAKTNGYHVVVASHVKMASAESLTYLDSGFQSPVCPKTTPSANYPYYVNSGFVSAVDTFVSGGGTIACWLCGHMHVDMLAKYNNVLNIGVTTAGDLSTSRTYDARIAGTKSYDAFNIVGIDTVHSRVSVMKVGLDYNAGMRKMDTFSWDYANNILLHTS